MNKDRKEYYRNYRLNHKEQYRKYSKKYRENNITTYERLKQENEELMRINEGVHKAREKETETINKLAMVLVNLREWLEEDKDKINVLDTKNNSSVKLGIVIGLGMCLDKLNELEGKND